jgi:hypothetical protein
MFKHLFLTFCVNPSYLSASCQISSVNYSVNLILNPDILATLDHPPSRRGVPLPRRRLMVKGPINIAPKKFQAFLIVILSPFMPKSWRVVYHGIGGFQLKFRLSSQILLMNEDYHLRLPPPPYARHLGVIFDH